MKKFTILTAVILSVILLIPLIAPTASANTLYKSYTIPAQGNNGYSHLSPTKIGDLSVTGTPKIEITFTYSAGVQQVRVYRNDLANSGPVDVSKITTYELVPTNKKVTLDFGNTALWTVLTKNTGNLILRVEYTNADVRFYSIKFEKTQSNPPNVYNPPWVTPTPPPSVFLPGGPSTDLPSNSQKISSIPAKFSGTYTAKLPLAYGTGTVKISSGNTIAFNGVYVNVGHMRGFSNLETFYDKTTIYKVSAKTNWALFSTDNAITISGIYEKPDGGLKIKANVIVINRILGIIPIPESSITLDIDIGVDSLCISNVKNGNFVGYTDVSNVIYKK